MTRICFDQTCVESRLRFNALSLRFGEESQDPCRKGGSWFGRAIARLQKWTSRYSKGHPESNRYHSPSGAKSTIPAARFEHGDEQAVLSAVNDGRQYQVCAILAGALVGAYVELAGIPPHLIDGLNKRDTTLELPTGSSHRPS